MVATRTATKYGFTEGFEIVLAVAIARMPSVYGKIGKFVDTARIASRPAALLIDAAHAVARDTGNGPSSDVILMQRVKRAFREGKVSRDEFDSCFDVVSEITALPTEEEIVSEAAAVVRKVRKREVAEKLLLTLPKDGNTTDIADELSDVDRIGIVDSTFGSMIGGTETSIAELLAGSTGVRLPTGIPDLDMVIDGGPTAGTLSMAMGGPGTGKSMLLTHVSVEAMLRGMNVALATLELSEREQMARMLANLTGVSNQKLVSEDSYVRDEATHYAQMRFRKLLARAEAAGVALGKFYCKVFPGDITTPRDIRDWITQIEAGTRSTISLAAVDYIDLLVDGRKEGSRHHESQKRCATELRAWASESKTPRWVWTASQSKGRDDGKTEYLDLAETAESMGKPRIADLFVTFKRNGETKDSLKEEAPAKLLGFVAKNRFGTSRRLFGPFDTDFPQGRFCFTDRWIDAPDADDEA